MAVFFHLSWWRRAMIVLLSLAGSTLLAMALAPVLHDQAQLLPFTVAVIICSTYAGVFAGLLATVLSFVIADFFFMEPRFEMLSVPGDYALLFIFVVFGISLSIVNHALARANHAVLEHSRQLALSNEELQRFAYSVSHDLQEPLRGVRAFTELFLHKHGKELDAESTRWLEFVRSSAERMKRLIEAILEFSAAGQGIQRTEVDAWSVAKTAVDDLATAIQKSGAEIRLMPLPVVWADEKQLGRVFLNLIGNAIKYRAKDHPVIVVSGDRRADHWVFSVKDNGPGIRPEDRARIFETFQRASRTSGGFGLGLATCRRIIEQHGGVISVESQPGQGCEFRFTLSQPSS